MSEASDTLWGTDGPPMGTRRKTVERRIARLEAELARLEELPEEPIDKEGNGVIWFQKTFGGNTHYTYAAVRVPGLRRWITTATDRTYATGYRWDELLDFIASREPVMPPVWLATVMEQLI